MSLKQGIDDVVLYCILPLTHYHFSNFRICSKDILGIHMVNECLSLCVPVCDILKNDVLIFTKLSVIRVSYFLVVLDHNECNAASHGCEQKCVNAHGSYSCACLKGYQLNNDSKTCSG